MFSQKRDSINAVSVENHGSSTVHIVHFYKINNYFLNAINPQVESLENKREVKKLLVDAKEFR